MKTIKIKFVALLVMLAGIGVACSVDDGENYCFSTVYIEPESVTGPTTTTVNVPITLNVSFKPGNSCAIFNDFSESTTFPKEIKLVVDYDGCQCTPTTQVLVEPYVFSATTPGQYVLKFLTATPNEPIERTIKVTE